MNLETKITIYKFTPQLFTLTQNTQVLAPRKTAPEESEAFMKDLEENHT